MWRQPRPPTQEEVEEQLQTSRRLEKQLLESVQANHNSDTVRNLRTKLCETYSDVIICAPFAAHQNELAKRLWLNCFYKRIGHMRNCIARKKRDDAQLRSKFNAELSEAITLIEFLIGQYEEKVLQPAQPASKNDMESVIPVFYRLLMYQGDLYRYKMDINKAASVYKQASQLAPTRGDHYNQLAVLAQQQQDACPMFCNALYYYARAVMATIPFDTSRGNIPPLMKKCASWVEQLPRATLDKEPPKRSQKSAVTRRFLAEFVKLHSSFWDATEETPKLRADMDELLEKFRSLLCSDSFGDVLLCNMAAINAFSVANKPNDLYSKIFALRFGLYLADRMEQSAKKVSDGRRRKLDSPPSVRHLVPTMMIAEFVADFEVASTGDALSQGLVKAQGEFWGRFASGGSMLMAVGECLDLDSVKGQLPKEYKSLYGYQPYSKFIKTPGTYLSREEAAEILDLSDSAHEVEPNLANNANDRLVKWAHLKAILQRVDGTKLTRADDGSYMAFPSLMPVRDAPFASHSPTRERAEDDFVRYEQSDGGTVPLLVPSALLLNKTTDSKPTGVDLNSVAPAKNTNDDSKKALPFSAAPKLSPPPGLEPPPGFAPATSLACEPPGFASFPTVLDQLAREPIVTTNPFIDRPVPAPQPFIPGNQFLDKKELSLLDWLEDRHKQPTSNPFLT